GCRFGVVARGDCGRTHGEPRREEGQEKWARMRDLASGERSSTLVVILRYQGQAGRATRPTGAVVRQNHKGVEGLFLGGTCGRLGVLAEIANRPGVTPHVRAPSAETGRPPATAGRPRDAPAAAREPPRGPRRAPAGLGGPLPTAGPGHCNCQLCRVGSARVRVARPRDADPTRACWPPTFRKRSCSRGLSTAATRFTGVEGVKKVALTPGDRLCAR